LGELRNLYRLRTRETGLAAFKLASSSSRSARFPDGQAQDQRFRFYLRRGLGLATKGRVESWISDQTPAGISP